MTRESAQKHAALIRAFAAGHEIEFQMDESYTWDKVARPSFEDGCEYRIALPPNKSYHNPENITEEQLGKDHRFCLLEEYDGRFSGIAEYQCKLIWAKGDGNDSSITYRVPIETLFPSEPPAPKTRPFTVDDITPNMVFRHKTEPNGFITIEIVARTHILLSGKNGIGYEELYKKYLYSLDGKTFHPCSVNL